MRQRVKRWRDDGGLSVLTFGSGEEKVICAVDTENSFTVSLRHVDALQRRWPTAFSGWHRVNDAPGKHTHITINRCSLDIKRCNNPCAANIINHTHTTRVMLSMQLSWLMLQIKNRKRWQGKMRRQLRTESPLLCWRKGEKVHKYPCCTIRSFSFPAHNRLKTPKETKTDEHWKPAVSDHQGPQVQ